jgi:hypothetical protein
MNPNLSRSFHGGLALALILFALAGAGCAHKQKIPTAVPSQPTTTSAARAASAASSSEKRLQLRVDMLDEEVRGLSARVAASEQTYWGMMSPDWQQRVRVARANGANSSERLRYLEAAEAVLSRKLRALQEEAKTYEAYQMSDPLVPRK